MRSGLIGVDLFDGQMAHGRPVMVELKEVFMGSIYNCIYVNLEKWKTQEKCKILNFKRKLKFIFEGIIFC